MTENAQPAGLVEVQESEKKDELGDADKENVVSQIPS